MKQYSKKLFSLVVLFSATSILADGHVAPFLSFRSAGRNTARKVVGTTSHHVYLYDMESFYGTFNMTFAYERSFRPGHIADCLFGTSINDDRILTISGLNPPANTGVIPTGRGANDWMAENFLLPRDFKGTIKFTPRVQNFLVDFHLYVGLDEWVKGLYFRIYGPVVHARFDLNAVETSTPGTVGYREGFFAPAAVAPTALLQRALDFFGGQTITVPTITVQGLQFAKIKDNKKDSKTSFAELHAEFGWNWLKEDYHVGIYAQVAAPTGKRPKAEFLFEAQVGNNKHWEVGGGVSAHYTMWRSEDDEKHFDFVLEADVTHMFKAKQKRTFDLKNKAHSRYMLAARTDAKTNATLFSSPTAGANTPGTDPLVRFNNEYAPVANFSTRDIKVSIGAQGDVVAMFNYTARGFTWDVGYNLWARSSEKIELRDKDDNTFPEKVWTLKGDASTFGQISGGGIVSLPVSEMGSSATTGATIHAGAALPTGTTNSFLNFQVDNAQFAQTTNAGGTVINAVNSTLQIKLSNPPIFIKESDLDLDGAETRGISHKVFTHFGYTWVDREDWIPYIGVGAEAEFGKRDKDTKQTTPTTTTSSSSSFDCAVSKWSVSLKGGISFD